MKQNAFILVVLLLSAWVCGCSDGDLDSGAPNGVLDPFARADLGRQMPPCPRFNHSSR